MIYLSSEFIRLFGFHEIFIRSSNHFGWVVFIHQNLSCTVRIWRQASKAIFLASSTNLINWEIIEDENGKPKPIFGAREGKFDSRLVESGPPAMITKKGILLLYNSMNLHENGFAGLPPDAYSAGQILMDKNDPSKVIGRTDENFMSPDKPYELTGQVNQVVFIEGLVYFKKKYFLYYGTADSKIAVAVGNF